MTRPWGRPSIAWKELAIQGQSWDNGLPPKTGGQEFMVRIRDEEPGDEAAIRLVNERAFGRADEADLVGYRPEFATMTRRLR